MLNLNRLMKDLKDNFFIIGLKRNTADIKFKYDSVEQTTGVNIYKNLSIQFLNKNKNLIGYVLIPDLWETPILSHFHFKSSLLFTIGSDYKIKKHNLFNGFLGV